MSFRKTTYIYLLSNIANAAIPFILLPFLTRYLSPLEYGQIAMFQTMLSGLNAFIGVNTVGAANRKFYDKVHGSELTRYNNSCFIILILTIFVSYIFLLLADAQTSNFLSIPKEWLYISILVSSCTYITNFRLGQWQIRKKAKKYGCLQVGTSALNMIFTLIFIVLYEEKGQGRVDALLYSAVISSVISLYLLFYNKLIYLGKITKKSFNEALSFGIPLVPHVFGGFLLAAADRFIINNKLGLEQAGIYMVAMQVSMALAIIFDAINKAYIPWLFERIKRNQAEEKRSVVKLTYIYFLTLIALAALSFSIGPFAISLIAGNDFESSSDVIGWLCLGQAFGGMYLMVTNYMFYSKRTGMLSLVTMTCGFFNLYLMIVLVDTLGIEGASIAFAIAKFIQFVVTWVAASKYCPMPWFYFYKV